MILVLSFEAPWNIKGRRSMSEFYIVMQKMKKSVKRESEFGAIEWVPIIAGG